MKNNEQIMGELLAKYSAAKNNIKELSAELDKYTSETGEATGGAKELGQMLAEERRKSDEAKKAMEELEKSTNGEGEATDEATKKTSVFGDVLKANLASDIVLKGIEAIIAGVQKLATGIKSLIADTAAYGDTVDKMSQKMGLSAEAYQEWDFIMQHAGTSIESLKAGMKTLASAAETSNEAFATLGITQQQIASMSQEELFGATLSALQNVQDVTQRTYLAGQLLGRGATELGALLNMSAEETEAMRQQVHDLGGVMSDDAVKASAAYADSLQNLRTVVDGAKRKLGSDFLPSIVQVMDGLTQIFSGDTEGLEGIDDGINNIVDKINSSLPSIFDAGAKIVGSLGTAITKNLPKLAKIALDTVSTLANGFISNLPELARFALQAITTLANGLSQNLPTLIPTLVSVILEIVDILTDSENLNSLLTASIAIISGIADGLINAMPKLLEKAPEIIFNLTEAILKAAPELLLAGVELVLTLINGLVIELQALVDVGRSIFDKVKDGFKQKVDEAKQWGKDLIQNFIAGIKDKARDLLSNVKDLAQGIKDFLGFSEPKLGPLSNFHTYAPDMMKLFAQGVKDNEHLITDQIGKSFDFGADIVGTTRGVDTNASDSNFISEMRGMREDIRNMRVVLEDGTLVGKISPKVDTALGQRAAYSGRYVLGGA